MIQANELRIGNWVILPNGRSVKIDPNILSWAWSKGDKYPLLPIPLTPEILEMAGFVFNAKTNSCDLLISGSGMISICLDDNSFLIGGNHVEMGFAGTINASIKYVHQLQNLYFSLTGEEVKIDL